MTPEDLQLADQLLAHNIDLLRLDAHLRDEVLKILSDMQNELKAKLAASGDELSTFSQQRIQVLLETSKAVIESYYAKINTLMAGQAAAMPALQASVTQSALLDIGMGVALPAPAHFTAAARLVTLIQGTPMQAWWKKQAADVAFKFAAQVRQGIVQGETNQQIIKRIVGSKGGDQGVLGVARFNAASLVQTSVAAAANDARLKSFEQAADVVKELEWFTALDGHVCILCAARSGLRWTNSKDGTHDPVGHDIPFQNPPIHFNDRCVLMAKTVSFKDLGINIPEVKRTTRASDEGQISAKTTFDQFLRRKGKAFQDDVLGKGRADLWRSKMITLQQLLDLRGNPLTLDQLQERYA